MWTVIAILVLISVVYDLVGTALGTSQVLPDSPRAFALLAGIVALCVGADVLFHWLMR